MNKKMLNIFNLLISFLFFASCEEETKTIKPFSPTSEIEIVYSETLDFTCDKARYNTGEAVLFTVSEVPENTRVRYKHLNEIISEENLSSTTWSWTPPSDDFMGYLIELVQNNQVIATTAVDVSSVWTKFPRYGFLNDFGNKTENEQIAVLDNLKKYHINGLQYYDWHNKHHFPLPVVNGSPAAHWQDIVWRDIYFNTVENYIEQAKNKNIASMFYNLLFGVWEDYAQDGVSANWLIYNDRFHSSHNKHAVNGLQSDIYLTDPLNKNWQNYIFEKTRLVYTHLDFDGWHLDQLGNRNTVYDYAGNVIDLKKGYQNFLENLKTEFPNKKMVLNAVDQFGQGEILNAPVDFAYTEVWSYQQYSDLANVILENLHYSKNKVNTILAAYMHYEKQSGEFNIPSVLLTDAVIFAFGGAHLELGEHMLSHEYFPNSKLTMSEKLKSDLVEYYDFLVAYQNLLRDGGNFNSLKLESKTDNVNLNAWPPVYSKISYLGKEFSDRQIVHLLNFANASTLEWRDNKALQNEPTIYKNFEISIENAKSVSKVWLASPDYKGGAPEELSFSQENGNVFVKIPYLEYWNMIVLEF